jgi:hypothetical protein
MRAMTTNERNWGIHPSAPIEMMKPWRLPTKKPKSVAGGEETEKATRHWGGGGSCFPHHL